MNNNFTKADMNIEDYEDQAVKKSKLAKGIGTAAAGAVGGAAIGAGTTYAANAGDDDPFDLPISADEMAQGAEFGDELQPEEEIVVEETIQPAAQHSTQYAHVERHTPSPEPAHEYIDTPEVVWEDEVSGEDTNDDEVVMPSVEEKDESLREIHNNFEDEKTGEKYSGDFAEDNPDYNPRANVDYNDNEEHQQDMADASDMEDESYDSIMDSEEMFG